MSNSGIELHDTNVVAILEVGKQVHVVLRAYVHRWDESTGNQRHTGWIQAAVLTFTDGAMEGDEPDLPAAIWTGHLILDGERTNNWIPIPFHHNGEVTLEMSLDASSTVIVKGKQAVLSLIGEAAFVEVVPGDVTCEA